MREEALIEQMKSVIQKVSIPDDWAENMLGEVDREKEGIQNEGISFDQDLKDRKAEVEQKIDRLLDIYIEGKGISPDEYQAKKAKLLNEKADIDQEIRDFEQRGNNWLEPMREVILLSSQAKILLSQDDKTQIRAFLKNVGSNFMLNSKRLEISPKNGWRARISDEPMTPFPNWRRGWDSNPGIPYEINTLAVCSIRPLWHLSMLVRVRRPLPAKKLYQLNS